MRKPPCWLRTAFSSAMNSHPCSSVSLWPVTALNASTVAPMLRSPSGLSYVAARSCMWFAAALSMSCAVVMLCSPQQTAPTPAHYTPALFDLAVLVEYRLAVHELAPVGSVDLGKRALNVHAFHVCATDCGDDLVAEGVEVFCSAGRCDTVDAALEAVSQEGQGVGSGISVFPEVWASGHRLQHLCDLFQMASGLDGRVLACRLRHCGLEPLFCVLDGHLLLLLSCRLDPINGLCPSSSSHSNILPQPTHWRRFMLRRATSGLPQRGQGLPRGSSVICPASACAPQYALSAAPAASWSTPAGPRWQSAAWSHQPGSWPARRLSGCDPGSAPAPAG